MYHFNDRVPSMVINLSFVRVREFIIIRPGSWLTVSGDGTFHFGWLQHAIIILLLFLLVVDYFCWCLVLVFWATVGIYF